VIELAELQVVCTGLSAMTIPQGNSGVAARVLHFVLIESDALDWEAKYARPVLMEMP
jgi:hypothetical protein